MEHAGMRFIKDVAGQPATRRLLRGALLGLFVCAFLIAVAQAAPAG